MGANRGVNRPLGAGLFVYECLRLLLLIVFLLVASFEASVNGTYSVYMSSNALFPLMALFMWLRPEEYRNYSTLYIAGKIITLISFYIWEIISFREFVRGEDLAKNMILLGGGALLSLADMLSVWGAWMISKKNRRALAPESGGM